MSKYTALYHKIWSDKKFRSLSSESKLLFIYLLCYESMNISGIVEINPDLVNVVVPTTKGFIQHSKELVNGNFIKFDEQELVLWVINKFKFTYTKSGSVILGCIHELNHLNHPYKKEFVEKYKDILKPYIHLINGHHVHEDILTEEQVKNLSKINWGKDRIKRFYLDRGYQEQKIDQIINAIL